MLEKVADRGLFWDLDYYLEAVERYRAGEDVYLDADQAPTGYYYPLGLVPLLDLLRVDAAGKALHGLLLALAVGAALALSFTAFARRPAPWLLALVYALAFGNGQPLYLVFSGNLAWIAGLAQAGALLAACRRRWPVFYALVGAAALVKPHALALLAVPLALRALSPWVIAALLPAVGSAALVRWLWPAMVESRAAAIWAGVGEPLQLRYSLAGGLTRLLAGRGPLEPEEATLIGVFIQLALAFGLALGLRRLVHPGSERATALAAVLACAAMPRLASYDAFVFGPALFFAFWPDTARGRAARLGPVAPLLLASGLFKEGLVALPLLLVVWLFVEQRREGRAPGEGLEGLAPTV